MTLNLQIVLAIMGVIVVILICLISWWQNRRPSRDFANDEPALNRRDAPATRAGDDFIAADEPEAPGAADDLSISPDRHWRLEQTDDARTPVFGSTAGQVPGQVPEGKAVDFSVHPVEGFEQLSQIDYWGKITGERDVGRETVLAIYRDGAADFSKARGVYGFKTPEKGWCNLENEAEDSRFTDIVMTIQLADRNGAISEQEMTRFCALVSRLSEGTGREFAFMASVESAFAQADAIADFVRHFDSVFVINIHPREDESFDGTAIDRYAPQLGLERDQNHCYSRFKSVGKSKVALYSLADLSDTGRFDFDNMKSFSTDGLTFFTKPAVNRSPGAVFAEMVDTAKAFASRIKGEVNSPDHDDLSEEVIDTTRKSIERVAAEMEQLGIPAGSDEAARIF